MTRDGTPNLEELCKEAIVQGVKESENLEIDHSQEKVIDTISSTTKNNISLKISNRDAELMKVVESKAIEQIPPIVVEHTEKDYVHPQTYTGPNTATKGLSEDGRRNLALHLGGMIEEWCMEHTGGDVYDLFTTD